MKNKKFIIFIIIVLMMIIGIGIYIYIKSKQPIQTITKNEFCLYRDEKEISDEQFDEYGNLTHYKYKRKGDEIDSSIEEYNIKYEFDEQKRVTKAIDNKGNCIEIEYDDNNRILKVVNEDYIETTTGRTIKYDFNYCGEDIIVKKKITTKISPIIINSDVNDDKNTINDNETEENTLEINGYIKNIKIGENNYYWYTEKEEKSNNNMESTYYQKEYIISKNKQKINYSNLSSVLNYTYYGFINPKENKCEHVPAFWYGNPEENIFNYGYIEYPIFDAEKIIKLRSTTKDLNNGKEKEYTETYYYDKKGRILSHQSTNIERGESYFTYEDINEKEYKGTFISKYIGREPIKQFVSGTFKIYLDENGEILKKDIINEKEITGTIYEQELQEYKKYFEANKIEMPKIEI